MLTHGCLLESTQKIQTMMGILMRNRIRADVRVVSVLATMLLIACSGCNESGPERGALGPDKLAREVQSAFTESTQIGRIARLTDHLERLTPENLPAVLDVYDERIAGLSRAEVACFFSAWAQFDPRAAVDYATSIPFEMQREEALGVAIQEWAVQNPLEARPVAEGLEIRGYKRAAQPTVRLVRGWVHHSLTDLEDYLRTNPKNSEMLSAAIQEIYRVKGAEALIRWSEGFIATCKSAEHQWQTFRKTVRTLGYREPQAATEWVNQHYGNEDFARDGPEILALAWTQRDPPAALDWLATSAPPDSREEAIQAAFRRWMNSDPAKAGAWLDSRPDGPDVHYAYVAAAKIEMRARNSAGSIDYCGRVPASDLKQNCLYAIATIWYGFDPVAAGAWMESSELDPEHRDAVRAAHQRLPRRGSG